MMILRMYAVPYADRFPAFVISDHSNKGPTQPHNQRQRRKRERRQRSHNRKGRT